MNYEFEEDNSKMNIIELFGEKFVDNNKENCFLIINEKIIELSRFINLYDIFENIPTKWPIQLNVLLIERKYKLMTDFSYMFDGISTLSSKSNIGDFDSSNIRKMDYMFNNCKLLKELPDISKMNTENVTDMSYMFNNCVSLTHLPDISNWNTKNVNDISHMFQNCESLTSLPDISNWNTNNLEKMDETFSDCKSLSSLPNLLKWNIPEEIKDNVTFNGCQLLQEKFQYNYCKCRKLFKCLKNIFGICKNCDCCLIYSGLLVISFIFCYVCCNFVSLYYSFRLNEINEIISNPIKNFDLMNHINITYIAKLLNITNEEDIQKFNKNKEVNINYLLNFTLINNNVTFKKSESKLRTISIVHSFVFLLKLMVCILKVFSDYLDSKIKSCLFIFFILNIFSFILESINYFETRKLLESLNEFFSIVKKLFRIEIPESYENEKNKLNDSLDGDIFCGIFSLIFIGFLICAYKSLIERSMTLKTFRDYLNSGIN